MKKSILITISIVTVFFLLRALFSYLVGGESVGMIVTIFSTLFLISMLAACFVYWIIIYLSLTSVEKLGLLYIRIFSILILIIFLVQTPQLYKYLIQGRLQHWEIFIAYLLFCFFTIWGLNFICHNYLIALQSEKSITKNKFISISFNEGGFIYSFFLGGVLAMIFFIYFDEFFASLLKRLVE